MQDKIDQLKQQCETQQRIIDNMLKFVSNPKAVLLPLQDFEFIPPTDINKEFAHNDKLYLLKGYNNVNLMAIELDHTLQ